MELETTARETSSPAAIAPESGRVALLALFALAALPLLISIVLLGYTGRDDSHITYFVADAVAEGRGIVNYSGDPVEQSSSLLFTGILAAITAVLNVSAADIGYFASLAFYIMLGGGLTAAFRQEGIPPAFAALALLCAPALYWALSGMENSFYLLETCLLLYLLARYFAEARRPLLLPIFGIAAAMTLTRPEAPFVLICAAALLCILQRFDRKAILALGILLLAIAAAIGLRLILGLEVFPNTVHAKQALGYLHRLFAGLAYFSRTMSGLPLTSALCFLMLTGVILAVIRDRLTAFQRALCLVGLALTLVAGAFSIASGGDWMEAGRFFVPAYFILVVLSVVICPRSWRTPLAAVFVFASLYDLTTTARSGYGGIPLFARYEAATVNYTPAPYEYRNVIHARDISFIDRTLGVFAADPRESVAIGSIQAGMVPYYLFRESPKARSFTDFRGLASREVQSCGKQWKFDPYADLGALRACIGEDLDYVYDLDDENWYRLNQLIAFGCREVFREELKIQPVSWKAPYHSRQFLASCRGAGAD